MKSKNLARDFRATLTLIAGVAVFSFPALAQGLSDGLTEAVVPNSQTAATDDAWALFANPAGTAFVDEFQLVAGYQRFWSEGAGVDLGQGIASMALVDGFVLSLGGTYVSPATTAFWATDPNALNPPPYLRTSAGAAFHLDRRVALGANLHYLSSENAGINRVLLGDLGLQIRGGRWFALGTALEEIGARDGRAPSARVGLSVRPGLEWLTLGIDTRFSPRSLQAEDGYSVDPAVVGRLAIGGVVATAGVMARDAATNFDNIQMSVGLELNTNHIGGLLFGAGNSDASGVAGAGIRLSAESFDSLLPDRDEWLAFSLVGDAVPEPEPMPPLAALFAEQTHPIALLTALRRAAEDPAVGGVFLQLSRMSVGWARARELRHVIQTLRANGKQVVVHLQLPSDLEYYVASAADQIYLAPSDGLELNGVRITMLYFGQLLDMLGVEAEAVVAGSYKSAPRTFTDVEPSPEEVEVTNDLLNGIYGELVDGISEGRDMDRATLKSIIDLGGLTSDEALAKKLVDGLAYVDEMPDRLEALIGRKPRLREDYLEESERTTTWREPPQVAVIPITGDIFLGRGDRGLFGSDENGGSADIIDALDKAREDSRIKAVVLRIDSGGGDAFASDLIFHAVMRLREEKPVIASFGDLAASGAYYVGAGAQEIYAQPTTITGSIGVWGLLINAGVLAENFGVSSFEFSRGEKPGPTLLRGMSDDERRRLQEFVDWTYDQFIDAIVTGRGMTEEEVRKVAEGRVWTGQQALSHKLVDKVGGLSAAIHRARELADMNLAEFSEIVILTGQEEPLSRFRSAASAMVGEPRQTRQLDRFMRVLRLSPEMLEVLEKSERPQARPVTRVEVE
jgi:protease-4